MDVNGVRLDSKKCYYCQGHRVAVFRKNKRNPPPGAVDQNIYDEDLVWQCTKCNTVVNVGSDFRQCYSCKNLTLAGPYAASAQNFPFFIRWNYGERKTYGGGDEYMTPTFNEVCSNCATCDFCKKPIETRACVTEGDSAHFLLHSRCLADFRKRMQQKMVDFDIRRQEHERFRKMVFAMCVESRSVCSKDFQEIITKNAKTRLDMRT